MPPVEDMAVEDYDENTKQQFDGFDIAKIQGAPRWLVEAIEKDDKIEFKNIYNYRGRGNNYDVITTPVTLQELKNGELPGGGEKFSVYRDRDGKVFVGKPEGFTW